MRGLLASQPDKLLAWDTEAVYANPARYPSYARQSGGQAALGSWRTTRYVTTKPDPDMLDHVNAEDDALAAATKKRRVSLGSEDPPALGNGEVEVRRVVVENLHYFNRKRLADVVRKRPSISMEAMNNFITCYHPGLEEEPPSVRRRREGNCIDEEELESDLGSGSGSAAGLGSDALSSSQRAAEQTPAPPSDGRSGSRGGGAKSSKQPKGTPSFLSFEEGVARSIVYRSVVQSQPNVDEFEDGADSDAENIIDEDWRLELGDKLLSDFSDTSAQEKCYMNLWNQFVLREVYVYSDRRQLDVISMFANRYGAIIFRMHLEIIFVRHLRELYRRGLIDASGMHQAVVELGNARLVAEADASIIVDRMSQFSFHDRISRRAVEAELRRAPQVERQTGKGPTLDEPAREVSNVNETSNAGSSI